MGEPFLGEIRIFGINFAPTGWAFCNGQILPISQNAALFSLLGTQYGGNGTSNFALPDMRSRVGVGSGQGAGVSPYVNGEVVGSESHTLTSNELPPHRHGLMGAGGNASTTDPTVGEFSTPFVNARLQNLYDTVGDQTAKSSVIGPAGGNISHENRQPVLALNYCIAMVGVFPSRT